jgi:hypothetical protein
VAPAKFEITVRRPYLESLGRSAESVWQPHGRAVRHRKNQVQDKSIVIVNMCRKMAGPVRAKGEWRIELQIGLAPGILRNIVRPRPSSCCCRVHRGIGLCLVRHRAAPGNTKSPRRLTCQRYPSHVMRALCQHREAATPPAAPGTGPCFSCAVARSKFSTWELRAS